MGVTNSKNHLPGVGRAKSSALEEYLETILRLDPAGGVVRPVDIAEYMDVKAPTVTATLSRLRQHGYIKRDGRGVILTDEGKAYAEGILRRHRVAERFLNEYLGFADASTDPEIHDEACELEHAISPRILDALEDMLDNPSSYPKRS